MGPRGVFFGGNRWQNIGPFNLLSGKEPDLRRRRISFREKEWFWRSWRAWLGPSHAVNEKTSGPQRPANREGNPQIGRSEGLVLRWSNSRKSKTSYPGGKTSYSEKRQ